MIIMNIIEENLPFILIGLMTIVIVVLAYYTFIKPKPKNRNSIEDPKETEIDQAIINQDSNNLYETSKATSLDESSDEEKETEIDQAIINQDSNNLNETPKATSLDESSDESLNKVVIDDEESDEDENTSVEEKETEIDQAIISQDSNNLDETPKATSLNESSDESSNKVVIEDEESNEEKETKELGEYHIVYRDKDNKWIVNREGANKTIRVLHTKKEAIAYATIKAIKQDTNIVIHGRDGKIEKRGY